MRKTLFSFVLVLFPLTTPSAVLADGELDPTFGSSGFVLLDLSQVTSDSALGDLVIQPDGKIIIVGSSRFVFEDWNYAVARLRADGSLDNTFGGTGAVDLFFDLGGDNTDLATHVSLRPSGSILVGGTADGGPDTYLAFAQLTSGGLLDDVFGGLGTVLHLADFDARFGISDLEGERSDQFFRVLTWDAFAGDRLEIDIIHSGEPMVLSQQTFDNEYTRALGMTDPRPPSDPFEYHVGSQAGFGPISPDLLIIRELRFLGIPDPTYGDGGTLLVRARSVGGEWPSEGNVIRSFPGNRIVAAGQAWRTNGADGFITRRLHDGAPDPSFANNGQQYVAWNLGGDLHDRVLTMVVQHDRHIVLGATSEIAAGVDVPVIARLDHAGAYDTDFAGVGWRRLPDPAGYVLRGAPRIALTPDEDLIVACLAESTSGGTSRIYVARLESSHFVFGDGFESGDLSAW